jgi:hypothetical protein
VHLSVHQWAHSLLLDVHSALPLEVAIPIHPAGLIGEVLQLGRKGLGSLLRSGTFGSGGLVMLESRVDGLG